MLLHICLEIRLILKYCTLGTKLHVAIFILASKTAKDFARDNLNFSVCIDLERRDIVRAAEFVKGIGSAKVPLFIDKLNRL